jgi:hypothetical protein
MQTRQSARRHEPLILDGRVVDGSVELLGFKPKHRPTRILHAMASALVTNVLTIMRQISWRPAQAAPGVWTRA